MRCETRAIIPEILEVRLCQVALLFCHLVLGIRNSIALTHWALAIVVQMGKLGWLMRIFLY